MSFRGSIVTCLSFCHEPRNRTPTLYGGRYGHVYRSPFDVGYSICNTHLAESKTGLKFGASLENTVTNTYERQYTLNSNPLGTILVNFADNVIINGTTSREYANDNIILRPHFQRDHFHSGGSDLSPILIPSKIICFYGYRRAFNMILIRMHLICLG